MTQTTPTENDVKASYEALAKQRSAIDAEKEKLEKTIEASPEYQAAFEQRNANRMQLRGQRWLKNGYTSDSDADYRKSVDGRIKALEFKLAEPFVYSEDEPSRYGSSPYASSYKPQDGYFRTNIRDSVFNGMRQAGFPKSKFAYGDVDEFVNKLIHAAYAKSEELRALISEEKRLKALDESLDTKLRDMVDKDPRIISLEDRSSELYRQMESIRVEATQPAKFERKKAEKGLMTQETIAAVYEWVIAVTKEEA